MSGQRQCPYCGKYLADYLLKCPHCHKELRPMAVSRHLDNVHASGEMVRRGLLYMLLGATFYYFAAGHSPLAFPFEIPPILTETLLPLLFLSGAGLTLFGFLRSFFD